MSSRRRRSKRRRKISPKTRRYCTIEDNVQRDVPVFEREARVKCSSQSSVHASIDFRVIFLHGMNERYE